MRTGTLHPVQVLAVCSVGIFDTVTAQRGNGSSAYLFTDCDIAPSEPETLLGRPWGPLAHTVYKSCFITANIAKVTRPFSRLALHAFRCCVWRK